MKCCNCQKELSPDECHICESCSREIERRADEKEDEDGNGK